MQPVLPILTDEEVRRFVPPQEQSGFGALETPRGLLPLKALDVQARIDGLLAEVTVCQTFVNTLSEPLEATYIFPLPDRAAVTRFRMEVAGRVVEGLLKERGEARRDYKQAIEKGHRAAITEEDRSGVFTLRVGNLMPGEQATVRLTLSELLPYDDGEVTFRFPLVVAPRYIPGTPLPGLSVGDGTAPDTDAVPDASRITPPVLLPGFPNPVRLSLSVDLAVTDRAATDVRSSLHTLATANNHGRQLLTLNPGERLNRDFILRFRLGKETTQTSLVLHPDANGKGREGTFVLTLVPPTGKTTQRPRDLVFVVDRSGSMGGWKMVAARRALARMIDTLTDQDRFTVYAFDDTIETPAEFQGPGLVPATDRQRFRAVEFLAKLEARGGTEMARPLMQAVQQLAGGKGERDRILVLITDGQVGHEDQILRELQPHVHNLRIFTLGIDQAINAAFLRRLATLGGGLCELVESEDRLDAVLDKIHRRIGTPVLSDLQLEPAGLEVEQHSLVPRRLPDLFPEAPLVVLGRYQGNGKGSMTLRARDMAGRPWTEKAPASASPNPAIAGTWARGQVRELEDRYVTHPHEQATLEKQIVRTSLDFSVLCRFTAFVAVDVKEVVNLDGAVHRVTQPVEPAAGWAMLGTDSESMAVGRMMFRCAAQRAAPASVSAPPALPRAKSRASLSAPPLPSCAKSDGMLNRVGSWFGGAREESAKKAQAPSEPFDLTAYRRRTQDLLDLLKVGSGTDAAERLTRLGMLAGQLAALVEDLTSTGVPAAEIRPLEELLKELQVLLTRTHPTEADVNALGARAETVLKTFADGKAPASGKGRRWAFWK